MPETKPAVEPDHVERLIKAMATELALNFAHEGQTSDQLARSVQFWEHGLLEERIGLMEVLLKAGHAGMRRMAEAK